MPGHLPGRRPARLVPVPRSCTIFPNLDHTGSRRRIPSIRAERRVGARLFWEIWAAAPAEKVRQDWVLALGADRVQPCHGQSPQSGLGGLAVEYQGELVDHGILPCSLYWWATRESACSCANVPADGDLHHEEADIAVDNRSSCVIGLRIPVALVRRAG